MHHILLLNRWLHTLTRSTRFKHSTVTRRNKSTIVQRKFTPKKKSAKKVFLIKGLKSLWIAKTKILSWKGYVGSVWIELILLKLKTENWKHCSKIIFKCVNSAMGPIFNEKVAEKCNLWVHEQCTDTLFTDKKSTSAATKKKKKELKRMES